MTTQILLAGFGGQGILFAGKVLAYAGLVAGKQVSWLPSYGPEMRGGTANCSVILSDELIGSPIVTNPDVLIVLNLPSYEKFESALRPGGVLVSDSSLIPRTSERADIQAFYIPATKLAQENELKGLANIIVVGKLARETGLVSREVLEKAFEKSIPPRKNELLESNMKALDLGWNWA